MFLDRHQLHGVVARVLDPAEGFIGKLAVGAQVSVLLRHADVGLVDHRGIGALFAVEVPVRPLKRRIRHPDLTAEGLARHVHHTAGHVGGDALERRALPADQELHELAVLQGVPAVEVYFPYAVSDVLQRVLPLRPEVEVAREPRGVRAGQPLAEHPAGLGPVKAKVAVAVGEVGEAPLPRQMPARVVEAVQVHPDLPGPGIQGRVFFHQQPQRVVDVYHGKPSSKPGISYLKCSLSSASFAQAYCVMNSPK